MKPSMVVALLGLLVSCNDDETRSPSVSANAATGSAATGGSYAPAPTAPVVTPIVDAAPTAIELEAIALQEKIKAEEAAAAAGPPPMATPAAAPFNAPKLLGRSRSQVAKVLGREHKLLDATMYEHSAYDAAVMAQFENGKAAMFSVQRNGFVNTVENRNAVLAWMGATEDDTWRVQDDRTVQVWDEGALRRSEERHRVAAAIGDLLKRLRVGSAHAWGELNTEMVVRSSDGVCMRSTLTQLTKDVKAELDVDLRKLGFLTLKCGTNMGDNGPTIRLR